MKIFHREQKLPAGVKSLEDLLEQPVRYGYYDHSGFVSPMYVTQSAEEILSLKIPGVEVKNHKIITNTTKPFLYPLENGAYVMVFLKGKTKLSEKFSQGNDWLCAEKVYQNYELSGSLIGKLAEQYMRIGDIKNELAEEFTFRRHWFLIIMLVFGGIGLGFSIGVRLI